MIIGIDGKPLTLSAPNGLKHYAQNLLDAILSIDKDNTYIIFSPQPLELSNQHNIVNVCPPRIFSKIFWQIVLPILSKFQQTDIFHNLQQHGCIFLAHPKIVTTVHDLADERAFPSVKENILYYLLGRYVLWVREQILNKSQFFITISQSIRTEMMNHGINKPTFVIYNGVDSIFIRKKLRKRIKKKYILAMSDFSPRKNIVRILQAYSLLPQKIRDQYYLHIISSMVYPQKKISLLARNLEIYDNIVFHYNPSNDKILELYRAALVFLYPSLYEGFGLPILEAMACGCPVVTSNYGATKEIADRAAYLVDPESVADIHKAIKTFIDDSLIRSKYKSKGYNRVKIFSWDKTARETLKVYQEIYEERT